MTDLPGSTERVPLGGDVFIRAPGVIGRATLAVPGPPGDGARDVGPASRTSALDRALVAHAMASLATIELTIDRSAGTRGGQSVPDDDALEVELPAAGDGSGAILLARDESGALTWHFPVATGAPPSRGMEREPLRFRLPASRPGTPAPGDGARSIVGAVGRRVLRAFAFPVTDRLAGPLVERFAAAWEATHRPYRLRTVTPDNYTDERAPSLTPTDAEWARLSSGRALLFVHGTFSSVHSGFAGLSPEDIAALGEAYGHRLIGFDHRTLSHGPDRNAQELAALLPPGKALEVDIVCHSRGGLVTREIVERGAVHGLDGRLAVRNVVFVGVPNAGTLLSQPDHVVHMIDRLTTAVDTLPDGPATWILEGLITALKVIGHGGLASLDGLVAMHPGGPYLETLGAQSAGRAQYFGVTADFRPAGSAFGALALQDAVMDRIFADAANDLVVPTAGVATATGPLFPIPADRMLTLPGEAGVTHTTYFSHAAVRDQLRAWLAG